MITEIRDFAIFVSIGLTHVNVDQCGPELMGFPFRPAQSFWLVNLCGQEHSARGRKQSWKDKKTEQAMKRGAKSTKARLGGSRKLHLGNERLPIF